MKKKKESITLNNNMKQLAAGIVPTATMGVHQSKNMINSTATLAKQVRADFITLNYPLLSFLYQQFGWIQSIVEVPVNDAFRGGIHISAYENKVVVPEKKHKKVFGLSGTQQKKKTKKVLTLYLLDNSSWKNSLRSVNSGKKNK